jgi:hypothetical protein
MSPSIKLDEPVWTILDSLNSSICPFQQIATVFRPPDVFTLYHYNGLLRSGAQPIRYIKGQSPHVSMYLAIKWEEVP